MRFCILVEHVRMLTHYAQTVWGIVWGCGDDPPQASSICNVLEHSGLPEDTTAPQHSHRPPPWRRPPSPPPISWQPPPQQLLLQPWRPFMPRCTGEPDAIPKITAILCKSNCHAYMTESPNARDGMPFDSRYLSRSDIINKLHVECFRESQISHKLDRCKNTYPTSSALRESAGKRNTFA